MSSSRRHFIRLAAASLAVAPAIVFGRQTPRRSLGVVLQQPVDTRAGQVLRDLAAAGVREVEGGLQRLLRLAGVITDAGLHPTSAFLVTPMVTGNWDVYEAFDAGRGQTPAPRTYTLDHAIADARKLGIRHLVVNNLLPAERRSLDDYRRFADQMNAAEERCAAAGLTLSYHPHSFENQVIGGTLPIDLLAQRFSGDGVGLEIDVFWVAMSGQDPADLIRRLGRNIRAVHLKDRSRTAPIYTGPQYEAPAGLRVLIGTGSIDFRDVLRACDTAGVAQLFIEDESPGDRIDNLFQSIRFLRTLGA